MTYSVLARILAGQGANSENAFFRVTIRTKKDTSFTCYRSWNTMHNVY